MTLVIHLAFGVGCKPGEPNIPVTLLHNVHMVPLALFQRTVAKVREACGGELVVASSGRVLAATQNVCSCHQNSVIGQYHCLVLGERGRPYAK